MLEKLEIIHRRFLEVSDQMTDPGIMSDMKKYVSLNKEYKELDRIEKVYQKYKTLISNISESKEILSASKDAELKEMAKMELDDMLPLKETMEEEIKWLLVPKDPEDAKNAQVEIRAGAGGDEASIFAGDLFRMYTKFCESRGWKVSIADLTEGTSGGFKEIIFDVSGNDVYGVLKYESGVHRVQRVPQTETQGRVHTSASSVIVLPEAEEFDIEIKDADLRIDSYCSSGPGGQSVNTTYSAIRITHMPTGIVAQCQDQKSKIKNQEKAMKVLRNRIYEMELQKKLEADQAHRKTLVSSSDRSSKIRTYNYPQSRVTDHRIGLTLYTLDAVLNGDIQKIIDELTLVENTERLKEGYEQV